MLSENAFADTTAVRVSEFLGSIGTQSAISVRGENLQKTTECASYLGVRWLRGGIEGNVSVNEYVALHRQTGVQFSWFPGSGGTDLKRLLSTARQLAAANALLAFEGPNEPNNWAVTYEGQQGGRNLSWVPVANFMRDLFAAVKSDPALKRYPVWSISEGGAETDNVGLQFLTIPADAQTTMPAGTKYADYANVHNYIYHPNAPGLEDNKTWKAADPSSACKVDGLFGEYGTTWAHHYRGYSEHDLISLPRVTTETGCTIDGQITEEIHGLNLLTLYLDQFKRGWSYTAVYLLRDRVDEAGNQKFGFYKPDYTPRRAAIFLHNLTTILKDKGQVARRGSLNYSIGNTPETVHDLLLQKSDGAFELVIWDERVAGSDMVTVDFAGRQQSVSVYDPTIGISPVAPPRRLGSIRVTLSNHPVILEIRPSSGLGGGRADGIGRTGRSVSS